MVEPSRLERLEYDPILQVEHDDRCAIRVITVDWLRILDHEFFLCPFIKFMALIVQSKLRVIEEDWKANIGAS